MCVTVCRKLCNLTFYEHQSYIYIVTFMKHVYVQYAAEPNQHTYIRTYMHTYIHTYIHRSVVLLQFPVFQNETPSHQCTIIALFQPDIATLQNQRLGLLAQKSWTFRHLFHYEFQPEAIFWILNFKFVASSSFRLAKAWRAALTGTVFSVVELWKIWASKCWNIFDAL